MDGGPGSGVYDHHAVKAARATIKAKEMSKAAERAVGGPGLKADAHSEAAHYNHQAMLAHKEAFHSAPSIKEQSHHYDQMSRHEKTRDEHVRMEKVYRD